jgi:hypothetical protein
MPRKLLSSFIQILRMTLHVFISRKFAALNFASLVILGVIAIMYEKFLGEEQTRALLYGTSWFNGLIILIAINGLFFLVCSYALRRCRVIVLIVYTGAFLFLAGIVIGNLYGIEGRLALMEGETGDKLCSEKSETLRLTIPDRNYSRFVSIQRNGSDLLKPNRGFQFAKGIEVQLQKYFPYTRQEMVVRDGGVELNPAIELNIESSSKGIHQNQWLFSKVDSDRQIEIGPAVFHFADSRTLLDKGLLQVKFDGQEYEFPILHHIGKKIQLKHESSLFIRNYFAGFLNQSSALVMGSENSSNPAVILELERPAGKSFHCVIANRSDLAIAMSSQGAHENVDVRYQSFCPSDKPEVVFSRDVMGAITYWVYGNKVVQKSGVVEKGKELNIGWPDFKVRVDHILDHASIVRRVIPDKNATASNPVPGLEIVISKGGEQKRLVLGWEMPQSLTLNGEQIIVNYGTNVIPLGFKVTCEKLSVGAGAGSSKPLNLISKLVIKDLHGVRIQRASLTKDQIISYRGYQIKPLKYQDGMNDDPQRILLQITSDPGRFVKWLGIVLMVTGSFGFILFPRRKIRKEEPLSEFSKSPLSINLQQIN